MSYSPIKAPEQGRFWKAVQAKEISLIRQALRVSGGSTPKAAEWLGVNKAFLYRRIEAYGL